MTALSIMTAISPNIKFLFVDDNVTVSQAMSNLIKERISGTVDRAYDGEEGLERFCSGDYDLVIADLNMPRMDGEQMVKGIREKDSHVKVIAFSMMDDQISVQKMIEAGANAYVLKDGDPEEFFKAIDLVLRNENYISPEIQF